MEPRSGVLLLAMPFSLAMLPSLALSLLKAELAARGISAELRYLYLDFARRVGLPRYNQVIARDQSCLVGEWIFNPALHGPPSAEQVEAYWNAAYPDALNRYVRMSDETFENVKANAATMQEEATRWIDELAASTPWLYRIVGFSTTFHQNVASLALARRIKERSPGTLIVFGGANCEAEMGMALLRNYPFIDCVFSGESDETFPAFAQAVLEGRPFGSRPGVIVRDPTSGAAVRPPAWVSSVTNLDALPLPDFEDFFTQSRPLAEEHGERYSIGLPFETSRGCWWGEKHHCTFCGLNGMTMAFRSKSVPRAISEVYGLLDRYGPRIQRMQAVDNILDMHYFEEFLPALARRPENITYFYETKANLTRKQIYALAQAHVQNLQPGIESLSSSVLQLMRKGVTGLQNVQLLKWCAEAGIRPSWNLIYGFPHEDREAYAEAARLVPYLRHLQPPSGCSQLRLDRFSPFFRDPASLGMVNVRPYAGYREVYRLPDEELRDIAYYFEFDYADDRGLEYTHALVDRCGEWTGTGGSATLVGFANDERVLVWDTRPVARAEWIAARGLHRAVLLGCDAVAGRAALCRRVRQQLGEHVLDADVDAALEDLKAWGLLIREGDHLLSLVVFPPEASAPAIPRRVITEIPERLTATAFAKEKHDEQRSEGPRRA